MHDHKSDSKYLFKFVDQLELKIKILKGNNMFLINLVNYIHCSKKLKEHFENTSDLNVKKYYVGYLY